MSDEARVHAKIAEACLAVSGAGAEGRLALYRRLVRNNLTGVTEKMLARTRARLNEARGDGGAGAFDASFAAFLEERGPRTHYLRDVPHEFLAWAEATWPSRADLPAWALDLARHELVEYAIAAARAPKDTAPALEIALDRALLFAEPLRVVRYAFAVHELPEDEDDRTEPVRRPTTLLVYRDAEHDVELLELSPLAAALTTRLLEGATLGAAVTGACTELALEPTEALLQDVSRLLASLADRGIVLGARDASSLGERSPSAQ